MRDLACKFTVVEKRPVRTGQPDGPAEIRMTARYDESLRDKGYAEATPTGDFVFTLTNPAHFAQFNVGDVKYITISDKNPFAEAEKAKEAAKAAEQRTAERQG